MGNQCVVTSKCFVNQRAKLTRVLGETALKSFHPRLYKIRYFIGASWSVTNGYYCGSQGAHLVSGESISSIARSLKISRPTVRKHLSTEVESVYNREHQPEPKLGSFKPLLEQWL